MTSIPENIRNIRRQIALFEQKYGRIENSVHLLAVSKTQSAASVREALTCGQHDFGENYQQEALEKVTAIEDPLVNWHFIGPIQSNKTKTIAENFNWVHSVDRFKIAQRLNDQRPLDKPPLNIYLQVNVSEEESKSGVSLESLPDLAQQVSQLPMIRLCGLMAIPAQTANFESQRAAFKCLALARDNLILLGLKDCQLLSMGMSRDYEAAIAEGASLVRIGTDIFGARQ